MSVKRVDWGPGPWKTEPDHDDFEHCGLMCAIQRHDELGHLCGYVCVPARHMYFGVHHDHVPYDVHRGLTYSGRECYGREKSKGEWWLGFDCAHFHDIVPGIPRFLWDAGSVYRTMSYVREQCRFLAGQVLRDRRVV